MPKQKDKYQVSLKILLKNRNGEILALGGAKGGTYEGYYDFPGGRIDTDEFEVSFTEIIKRELEEEVGDIEYKLKEKPVALGRHLITPDMTSSKQEYRILYVFFEAEYISGEIKISDEHTSMKWLNLNNINPEDYFKSGNLQGVKMYLN